MDRMKILVDNDILLKVACYGLFDEIFPQKFSGTDHLGMLGAARFVVTKIIRKRVLRGDSELGVKRFNSFIGRVAVIEPTTDEQIMAADFEAIAQRTGVALDSGESQICAIIINRSFQQMLTGDKRAIQAINNLLELDPRLKFLGGKIKCFEQLILQSISDSSVQLFRASICSEPEVDKTLSICFSCSNTDSSFEEIKVGLNSYINDLRKRVSEVLAS